MKCPTCNQHELVPGETDYNYNVGEERVTVMVPSENCPGCGESLTGARSLQAGERTISLGFLKDGEPLTGSRLKFIRKSLGWTVTDMSRTFETTPNQIQKWENSTVPIPNGVSMTLRAFLFAPQFAETP